MPQSSSKRNPPPSFVKVKTAPRMREFALMMAKMKKATAGISKADGIVRDPELTDEQLERVVAYLGGLSNYNVKTAGEAIALLKGIRRDVQKYVKSL